MTEPAARSALPHTAMPPHALTRRGLMAGAVALGAAVLTARQAQAAIEGTIIVGKNGWLFPTWEKVQEAYLKTVDQVTPIISGAVKQFKAAGIETVVTLIPMRSRVYPQFLPADAPIVAAAQQRYGYGMDQLKAQGVTVPDLAALFIAQAQQPAPPSMPGSDTTFVPVGADLFFKADSHWTTMASLPAANAVAQAAAGLQLPASSTPGVQLGEMVKTLQEKNDLAELLPAAEQSRYPFESYMLPQAAADQGENALIAGDAADVVVIGNSYMQPKYGFPAQLSNKLNRPVSLFWKIDRYGPFATMAEYLKSDLFKQNKPKLIVWNFRESQLEHLPDEDDFYAQNAMKAADLTAAIKAALG